MRLTATACLLGVLASTAGCTHPRTTAAGVVGTLAVASAGLAVGGLAGYDESSDVNALAVAAIGIGAIGAAVLGGTAVALVASEHRPTAEPVPPAEPPPPALVVARVAPSNDGLPMRTADEETLRLARQAHRAASMHQCAAVRLDLRRIASRDEGYHDALLAMPWTQACR